MTVEQTETIDFITLNDPNETMLIISDHLSWDDEENHLLLLQEKINAYIRFAESGEIYNEFPMVAGRPIVFSIIAKFDPSKRAEQFLSVAGEAISGAGFELRFKVDPST